MGKKNAKATEKSVVSEGNAGTAADSGKVLKVLYLHGYEEQVSGAELSPKPKCLIDSADLDVLAPELLVWMYQWNSPLWQMLTVPYFHASLFFRYAAALAAADFAAAAADLPPVARPVDLA